MGRYNRWVFAVDVTSGVFSVSKATGLGALLVSASRTYFLHPRMLRLREILLRPGLAMRLTRRFPHRLIGGYSIDEFSRLSVLGALALS